jgi:hypothetical protein
MVILVQYQANELGRVHDMERFRKQLRGRLVRRHDHKEAVDPRFDKPAVREGDQRRCIDNNIVVVLPRFLQEFSKARQLEHIIRGSQGVARWQDVEVEWQAWVHYPLEGKRWL